MDEPVTFVVVIIFFLIVLVIEIDFCQEEEEQEEELCVMAGMVEELDVVPQIPLWQLGVDSNTIVEINGTTWKFCNRCVCSVTCKVGFYTIKIKDYLLI